MWPALLVLAVLVLLPVGVGAATVPLMLCVIGCGFFFWRDRHKWVPDGGLRLACVLFACYWLSALISAFDSIAPGKSWLLKAL